MVRTNYVFPVLRNSTRGERAIQEFVNSNLANEPLGQRAAPLLNSKQLQRDILGLTPDDQTKFMEKVDQVCRDAWWFIHLS